MWQLKDRVRAAESEAGIKGEGLGEVKVRVRLAGRVDEGD